jgi:hypothetical protein
MDFSPTLASPNARYLVERKGVCFLYQEKQVRR